MPGLRRGKTDLVEPYLDTQVSRFEINFGHVYCVKYKTRADQELGLGGGGEGGG